MKWGVSDEQAALLDGALSKQHGQIAKALGALARALRFREDADERVARDLERPDVLRRDAHDHLFVGIARGFTEPVHDVRHHEIVRAWTRRFAELTATRKIAGGYVMVGAHDDASAAVWASVMTQLARAHDLHRDGALARFVVQPLGAFWVAC